MVKIKISKKKWLKIKKLKKKKFRELMKNGDPIMLPLEFQPIIEEKFGWNPNCVWFKM